MSMITTDLPVGDYEIRITQGFPTETVPPASRRVRVIGGGTVDPSSTVNFSLAPAFGVDADRAWWRGGEWVDAETAGAATH